MNKFLLTAFLMIFGSLLVTVILIVTLLNKVYTALRKFFGLSISSYEEVSYFKG